MPSLARAREDRAAGRGRRCARAACRRRAARPRRSRAAAGPAGAARVSAWTRRAIRTQPLRAVVDGVHRGHHREQHLRGADVARGLLAPDVLLAGLQRQPEGRAALGVLRHADEAPGHVALVLVLHREEGGVRTAVAQRHAEALRRAERDVGAHLAGRRSSVSASRSVATATSAPAAWARAASGARSRTRAVGRRVLDEHAEQAPGRRSRSRRADRPPPRSRAARRGSQRPRSSAGGSPPRRRSRPARAWRARGRASSPRRRRSPRRAARRWRAAAR